MPFISTRAEKQKGDQGGTTGRLWTPGGCTKARKIRRNKPWQVQRRLRLSRNVWGTICRHQKLKFILKDIKSGKFCRRTYKYKTTGRSRCNGTLGEFKTSRCFPHCITVRRGKRWGVSLLLNVLTWKKSHNKRILMNENKQHWRQQGTDSTLLKHLRVRGPRYLGTASCQWPAAALKTGYGARWTKYQLPMDAAFKKECKY